MSPALRQKLTRLGGFVAKEFRQVFRDPRMLRVIFIAPMMQLTIFGYALQWGIGGGEPWVFHAVSVLLHLTVSILVLALLRKLSNE